MLFRANLLQGQGLFGASDDAIPAAEASIILYGGYAVYADGVKLTPVLTDTAAGAGIGIQFYPETRRGYTFGII